MASSYHLVSTSGSASERAGEISAIESRHSQDAVDYADENVQADVVEHAQDERQRKRRYSQRSKDKKVKLLWKRFSASLTDGWIVEIVSLLMSAAFLIGLAVLLQTWNHAHTADWNARIALPTVIAILSKAAQVTLVLPVASVTSQLGWLHFRWSKPLADFQTFDAASRSPWGNVLLLFRVPSWWTILGVLIMVPALGFEAAAQQCLAIQTPANIPIVTQIYDLDTYASGGGLVIDGLRNAGTMAMSTKDEVKGGGSIPPSNLHGNSRTETVLPQDLIYSCSSPGCGPAPYASLAFCSTCADITDDLLLTCDNGSGSGCAQLPNGAGLQSSDQVLAINSSPVPYSYNASWRGEILLANFSIVEYFGPLPSSLYVQPIPHAAQQCSITLCLNVYLLDATQGETGASGATETVLANITQAAPKMLDDGRMGWALAVPNALPLKYPQDGTGEWNSDGKTTWGIDNKSLPFMANYFASLFNGTSVFTSSDGVSTTDASTYAQKPAGSGFWNSIAYTLTTYGYSGLDDVTNQVNGVVTNIVSSMGNWARDFYYDTGTDQLIYDDPVLENTYRILWPWMIFPAALELLAAWLLLWTILETRRLQFPIWKTNSIAAMLCGIPEVDGVATEGLHRKTASAMEELAARKRVRLVSMPRGFCLVDAPDAEASGRG